MSQPATTTTETSTEPPADQQPDTEPDTQGRDSDHAAEYGARIADSYCRINLGCGQDIRDDHLNVDIRDHDGVDFVWDLDDRPWPWPDNAFESVEMHNVLEHLDDHLAVLEEVHRITRMGGTVTISGPHWNSPGAWIDPTHTRPFSLKTFEHELVRDKFVVVDKRATCIRWGRFVPDRLALTLADHLGHGVSEIEVELDVRSERYFDNRERSHDGER